MSKGMLRPIKSSYLKPIVEGYTIEVDGSTAEALVQDANIDTLTRLGSGTFTIKPRLTGVRAPVIVGCPGEDAASGSFSRRLANPTTSLYTYQNGVKVEQPLVHFKCEDNAASTVVTNSGTGSNGTANRNTNAWSTASGKIDRGFDFYNGSTLDRIDLGSDVIAANGAFSFSAWVNPQSLGPNFYGVLFSNASYSAAIQIQSTYIFMKNGEAVGVQGAQNQLKHYCFVREANSASVRGYVNGVLDPTTINYGTAATIRYIGARPTDFGAFDGIMDDIRIYNRALTPAEIAAIYNAGTGTHGQALWGSNGVSHLLALGHDSARATKVWPRQYVKNRSNMPRMMGMLVDPTHDEIFIGSTLATLETEAVTYISTLTFTTPFERTPVAVAIPINPTAATAKITAISTTAVSVEVYDADTSAVAPYPFYLMVFGWDRETEQSGFVRKVLAPLVKPRLEGLRITLAGTTASLAVGADIASVTRTGVGAYTLTLTKPFKQPPVALAMAKTGMVTIPEVDGVSEVKVAVFNQAGSALDDDVDVFILGTDSPSEYAGPMPDELPSGNGSGDGGLPALPAGD